MLIAHASRGLRAIALIALLLPIVACGDKDPTGPGADPILGTWQATSFIGEGNDVIAAGMTLRATFAANNTYTFVVTNDMVGVCSEDGGNNCTDSGPVSHTAAAVIIDAGTADATTFNYTITGNTMSWTGSIDGTPVSLAFTRVT